MKSTEEGRKISFLRSYVAVIIVVIVVDIGIVVSIRRIVPPRLIIVLCPVAAVMKLVLMRRNRMERRELGLWGWERGLLLLLLQ